MLELRQITKEYPSGEDVVRALKGIDLKFRTSEFVSILGPSGCGKTTLLNIIGGLDGYTEGDLIINGKSTKDFKARDWDTYRNHSIGFVFQSYNLIPHQTVLQNVELALTVSGVKKAERKDRAVKALEAVGLGDQINKRPAQMSGGQMQRVAIARALVNNPDIILADEPTGALDTETSVQVMEILKEVSKDRLVVMVTHNPELAEKYSSRIIRMLDGLITDDSMPLTDEDIAVEAEHDQVKAEEAKTNKKPKMSFFTALRLSLKNLFIKKGRTMLTSFAGSIGIIGIALILAVSSGMTGYINTVQRETMATYPLTIQSATADYSELLSTLLSSDKSSAEHDNDAVYQKSVILNLANAIGGVETHENDLKSFKEYLDGELENADSKLHKAVSGVHYTYPLDLLVYTKNVDGEIIQSDAATLMSEIMRSYLGTDSSYSQSASMLSSEIWEEFLPGENGDPVSSLVKNQYELVYGSWANSYDQIMLVLDENNEMSDVALYVLGLLGKEVIDDVVNAVVNGAEITPAENKWSYESICGTEIRAAINSDCFTLGADGNYSDMRSSQAGMQIVYNNALKLKISGIIKPSSSSKMLSGSVCYTQELTKHVIQRALDSDIVKAQNQNPDIDVFTGLPFSNSKGTLTNAQKESMLKEYAASLNAADKSELYLKIKSVMPLNELESAVNSVISAINKEDFIADYGELMAEQTGMNVQTIEAYLNGMNLEQFTEVVKPIVTERIKSQYAQNAEAEISSLTDYEKAAELDTLLHSLSPEAAAEYYNEVMEFSKSSYEDNLKAMGAIDLSRPNSVSIYVSGFEDKDIIVNTINEYNQNVSEEKQIKYTDIIGMLLSSITQIINAITYVLIAFVAISLVVSSIMVGVITLISVQERTKEIGILRAIGASKGDVSSMFNAETLLIGFASGAFGVAFTYLLCLPINLILHAITGISGLKAILPPAAAIVLICISMVLTLISGLIPSRSAAKKDPVIALRNE